MGAREDEAKPCSPFTYIELATHRITKQTFYITADRLGDDADYKAHPIAAIVTEQIAHTTAERKLFLDNIVVMLELMEAQRDVDTH